MARFHFYKGEQLAAYVRKEEKDDTKDRFHSGHYVYQSTSTTSRRSMVLLLFVYGMEMEMENAGPILEDASRGYATGHID